MSEALWPDLTPHNRRFDGKPYDAFGFDWPFFACLADILQVEASEDRILEIRAQHFVAFFGYFAAKQKKAREKTPREENAALDRVFRHARDLSAALRALQGCGIAHQRMFRSAMNHDDKARPGGVELQDLLGHPQARSFELITDILLDLQRTAKRAMDHRYPIPTGPAKPGEQVLGYATPQTYVLDIFTHLFRGFWEGLSPLQFTEGKYPTGIENKADVAPVIRAATLCLDRQGTPYSFDQIYYSVRRNREERFEFIQS